jgi:hypothetical protein
MAWLARPPGCARVQPGRAQMDGIAAGPAMAPVLVSHVSWTRWRPQNWLRARRQPLSGLQDAPDALRPSEPPLPTSARIRRAPRQNDGAGAFLHMRAEPVQSSRSNDGGLREQERAESGIRASVRDKAHLLPSGAAKCGRAPCFPHAFERSDRVYSQSPLVSRIMATKPAGTEAVPAASGSCNSRQR